MPLIMIQAVTAPPRRDVSCCQFATSYNCFTTTMWASTAFESATCNFLLDSEKEISKCDGDTNIRGLTNCSGKIGISLQVDWSMFRGQT